MPTYTRLKGVDHIGYTQTSEQLACNLVEFFKWGSLCVGGFFNVSIGQSGIYGGDKSRLRLVDDPNFTRGQVWEGFRSNWVWESGVEYDYQPIQLSGVYINNSFTSISATGVNSHYVDFPNGRVIFNTYISPTSIVKAEYSYNWINWIKADVDWFRRVMTDSLRVDDIHFLQESSGVWDVMSKNRLQLPAVGIEVVPRSKQVGYQLGGGHYLYQDVLFHIYAETSWDRTNISDIITNQNDKTIFLFDLNRLTESGVLPLDYRGMKVTNAMTYPDLVGETNGWRNRRCYLTNMTLADKKDYGDIFYSSVRGTCELIFENF